uniref:Uncharacterized protein n=1 Tax=Quercus lobata TaxID=97700 RepID=A0A7N2LWV2_QUELO
MAHSIQRELSTLATAVDTSKNKSFQLSTLATAVDTSKNKSFHFFLTDSAVALLRHQNYWISGYSSAERRWSLEAVEKEFRLLSINERLKYDIESLVNVDNMKVQRTIIPRDNEVEENYIVAVEVLWSPQAEHDTLSVDELLEKYLLLRPI